MYQEKELAVVIGAGIAGIASAIRLANMGYHVEVFESNSYPGGKLSAINLGKYRFDAGPSLFTLPKLVEELFEISGKDPKHFEYVKCATTCHYFFNDGTVLPMVSDREQMLKDVEKILGVDPKPLQRHLEHSAYLYDKTAKSFLESSIHRFQDFLSFDILKTILAIPNLGIFSTMNKENLRTLNHPKLVQIFNRYATYNGSDPYQAPGILNTIPHLEHNIGTYFPKNGMHQITNSLVALAESLGVKFRYNSKVSSVLENGSEVTGIVVNGVEYKTNVVVCNSDIKIAYKKLLSPKLVKKKTLAQEPSSSAMIFYWGIKKRFDQLDLHNIFFASDYEKEFRTIFQEKTVGDDPTVYIHVSSKIVEEDAPEGKENWFVMVNVPSNSGQNWQELRQNIRRNILKKLSSILNEDIAALIEEEDYLDPVRIEQKTSSFAGALYGSSSNERMAAFFRHPNFSKIKGLYFAGGSVHPGGGIPLCLLSAKIACSMIDPPKVN